MLRLKLGTLNVLYYIEPKGCVRINRKSILLRVRERGAMRTTLLAFAPSVLSACSVLISDNPTSTVTNGSGWYYVPVETTRSRVVIHVSSQQYAQARQRASILQKIINEPSTTLLANATVVQPDLVRYTVVGATDVTKQYFSANAQQRMFAPEQKPAPIVGSSVFRAPTERVGLYIRAAWSYIKSF